MPQNLVSDSAVSPAAMPDEDDLGDLLLELLRPDGGTMANSSARQALSRAAQRPIGEEDDAAIRKRAFSLGQKDFKAVLWASAAKLRA